MPGSRNIFRPMRHRKFLIATGDEPALHAPGAEIVSLSVNSGHRRIFVRDGSVANDPKRTLEASGAVPMSRLAKWFCYHRVKWGASLCI